MLSSHILAEVEVLCDRVSIVRNGRTVESGTLADLRYLTRTSITAEVARRPVGLATIEGVYNLDVKGSTVRFSVDPDTLNTAVSELTRAGVTRLISQPPTLEELFLRHYETQRPDQKVHQEEVIS